MQWKRKLRQGVSNVFLSPAELKAENKPQPEDDLMKKIGQLEVENDFLRHVSLASWLESRKAVGSASIAAFGQRSVSAGGGAAAQGSGGVAPSNGAGNKGKDAFTQTIYFGTTSWIKKNQPENGTAGANGNSGTKGGNGGNGGGALRLSAHGFLVVNGTVDISGTDGTVGKQGVAGASGSNGPIGIEGAPSSYVYCSFTPNALEWLNLTPQYYDYNLRGGRGGVPAAMDDPEVLAATVAMVVTALPE
ncbi:MAG: hypothetical protein PHI85_00025 [Victivallaceae bacterium]|nr:hypothetical protein [Victivallaceae bacterium]